jgi:hypothetical protein
MYETDFVIISWTDGQTGSGKTFTMRGCDDDPGMMILCINDIFDFIDMKKKESKYKLKIAYMEVYNEEINDLLGEGPVSYLNSPPLLLFIAVYMLPACLHGAGNSNV